MALEIRETTPESQKLSWQQIQILLQPTVEAMPLQEDREYFQGIMGLLIGKEPRISNVSPKFMYCYILRADVIRKFYNYRQLIPMERIRSELIGYLNRLAIHLSENGLLVKYGVGGYQQQFVQQTIKQEQVEPKKKGWLW